MASLKLPEVSLGPYSISRLIAGGNPPLGHSHQTPLMDVHMIKYFTPKRIVTFLHRCSRQGINTWQSSYKPIIGNALSQFREEGGEINWICIRRPREVADRTEFPRVLELKPIGVAFHGEVTDVLWREGKIDCALDTLARIRDAGVLVGVSTHNPEVVEYIEEKDWDVDFYMTCVYRRSRSPDEFREILNEVPIPVDDIYLPSDALRMCETIRKAKRTCLAFKILAAGRKCKDSEQVEKAFEFIFGHIKPTDAVIVGMYPRYKNEIKENADLTRIYG